MQKDYELIKRRIAEVRSDKLPSAERFASQQRTLFTQGVASKNDLENANSRVFEVKNEISSLESSLVNKEVEIGNARSQITVIQQGANQGNTDKVIKVKETIAALRASIDRWKQTFLLIAPIEGRVSFFGKYWKEQQFVKTGDEVMVIVPEERQEQQKIVGKVNMPITGAGKVKEGQRVVMFLDSYPYEEFGSVDGKIESISLVPKDNMYTIQVAIPGDKIVTNYKKIIPQTQQLSGNAQIITEDKRFIQRIMDKVWGLTKKY
jgi:HlyD family secretion protein